MAGKKTWTTSGVVAGMRRADKRLVFGLQLEAVLHGLLITVLAC